MVAQTLPEPPANALKRPTSRLDGSLAESIAELVVKYRLTESEACLHLNVRPQSWFNWKLHQRNAGRYDDIIARIRAGQLQNVISSIDRAGDERTIVTRKGDAVQVQGDWRAKAWIAERVLAPERLGDRQQQPQAQVHVHVTAMLQAVKQVYGEANTAQVIDVQPVKQLTQMSSNDTQLSDSKTGS
jgi:hypothetical protein